MLSLVNIQGTLVVVFDPEQRGMPHTRCSNSNGLVMLAFYLSYPETGDYGPPWFSFISTTKIKSSRNADYVVRFDLILSQSLGMSPLHSSKGNIFRTLETILNGWTIITGNEIRQKSHSMRQIR